MQIIQELENEAYRSTKAYISDEDEPSALSAFSVKLDNYEGHFEALLTMIEKQSMEILEICLTEVTKQYLEYLSFLPRMDVSTASEFLLIAAYLIEQKSKSLLPIEEEAPEIEEIESCLIDHLSLYKMFKDRSMALKERKELYSRIYHRYRTEEKDPHQPSVFLSDVAISDIAAAFRKVWLSVKDSKNAYEIVDEIV
ncbi:MAG: segregation/condensation protein A, partial [Candidatus Margulisiibacteriota bacterium]